MLSIIEKSLCPRYICGGNVNWELEQKPSQSEWGAGTHELGEKAEGHLLGTYCPGGSVQEPRKPRDVGAEGTKSLQARAQQQFMDPWGQSPPTSPHSCIAIGDPWGAPCPGTSYHALGH